MTARAAATWTAATLVVLAALAGVARPAPDPAPAPVAAPTAVDRDPTPARPTPVPTRDAPAETLKEQLARIVEAVETVRGLRFDAVPQPVYLGRDELAARVADELDGYTPADADIDRRLLEALGAIPPGYDLRDALVDSYSQQVAGFYDPESGELVVSSVAPGERLGRLEEITLAHELQHALADQRLGLPPLDDHDGDDDGILARQALTEGDATLTMQEYVATGLSPLDLLLLPGEIAALEEELAGLGDLPHALQRSFEFPYVEGLRFVEDVRRDGGWEAVDAAYADPPTTTAEILFPDRYLAGGTTTTTPAPPPSPGEGWETVWSGSFGAADLLFLFEAPGDEPAAALDDPLAAVFGWRGGIVHVHARGDESAVAIALVGDLCDEVREWYERAFPDAIVDGDSLVTTGQSATVACEEDGDVRLGIAPDVALARRLAGT